jgi:propionate CoA-transferase
MAEADAEGNVNVSRFGRKVAGAGGFINISQNAKSVFFLGTFTARSRVAVRDGGLRVEDGGAVAKFRSRVGQVTFNGRLAVERGQSVHYITERCVLRLTERGLELVEVAPGIDVERDVLAHMEFRPVVSDDLGTMDPAIFRDEPMGLHHRPPLRMDERFRYDSAQETVYVNFEGLRLDTVQAAHELAHELDSRFAALGRQVHVVVNYDNFALSPDAADEFFAMVRRNEERFFLSSTRYSTNAFLRRQFGRQFTDHDLYANFSEDRR